MSVYLSNTAANLDALVLTLRRQGYVAYIEQAGGHQYLITNYSPTGAGFTYIGRREN